MDELKWESTTEKAWLMRQQAYLEGYPDFIKWNTPRRQPILAKPKALMQKWFERGVRYDDKLVDPFFRDCVAKPLGIRIYTNMPDGMQTALEIAAGEIKRTILEKLIPMLQWPDVIFRWGARPEGTLRAAGYTREHEFEAGCGPDAFMRFLPLGTVFETEHLPPSERVEVVSNNWYDLESRRQYYHINKFRIEESWQWGPNPYVGGFKGAIEGRDEVEQKLKQSSLSWIDQFIYCSIHRRKGFRYGEIAKGLRQLGAKDMTGDAVRKRQERIVETLIGLGLIKKRWLACQAPGKYKL